MKMIGDGVINLSDRIERGNIIDNLIKLYYARLDGIERGKDSVKYIAVNKHFAEYSAIAHPYMTKNKNSSFSDNEFAAMDAKLTAILKEEKNG